MSFDSDLPLLVTLARLAPSARTERSVLFKRLRKPASKELGELLIADDGGEGATDELKQKLEAIRQLAGVK